MAGMTSTTTSTYYNIKSCNQFHRGNALTFLQTKMSESNVLLSRWLMQGRICRITMEKMLNTRSLRVVVETKDHTKLAYEIDEDYFLSQNMRLPDDFMSKLALLVI